MPEKKCRKGLSGSCIRHTIVHMIGVAGSHGDFSQATTLNDYFGPSSK